MTKHVIAALGALVVAGASVHAAEQTILGSKLLIKNPTSSPTKRKIVGTGKEKASPNTIVGNPTVTGGSLTVFANGANPSIQTFSLPIGTSSSGKPFWSAIGSIGYRYKDSLGDNGPVKGVIIKKSPSGSFLVKATLLGKNGTINVLPPNPGTNGCVALSISGGDRYSVDFGPGSQIKNKAGLLFSAKKPIAQGICPTALPTTTTTTTTTSTTSTTAPPYGSPSRAFLGTVGSLVD